MKLIWSGTSPFARKCMIVAHELGIAETLEIENGSGTPVEPNALTAAYNPLGKLPCLVPDDGPAIFDSSVICQHLIAHREGQRLLPTEIDPRSRVLTLEALGDGICDAGVLVRYERAVRPENLRWENWIDSQFLKIDPWSDRNWVRLGLSRFPVFRARVARGTSGAGALA